MQGENEGEARCMEPVKPRFENASQQELGEALLALYRVLLPAEGDFNAEEQCAMDGAWKVLGRCGVTLEEGGDA